jgi:hypothetical protein
VFRGVVELEAAQDAAGLGGGQRPGRRAPGAWIDSGGVMEIDEFAHAVSIVHGGVTLTGEKTRQTACEDEDHELRRQAFLGMAHYRSARAFAVNPARLKARPLRAAEIDRSARPSKGAFMPRMEGIAR